MTGRSVCNFKTRDERRAIGEAREEDRVERCEGNKKSGGKKVDQFSL